MSTIMRWRILITAPYFIPVVEAYRHVFEAHGAEWVVQPVRERMDEDTLAAVIRDFDGVLCGDDPFTERVLAIAPRLKVISKWGTGVDSIDQAACDARGIAVCRTPGAFSHPVADSVLAYILSFARRTPWMDRAIKGGVWQKIPGVALNECTVGIIGMGDIGTQVAARLFPFGARLLGNDVRAVAPPAYEGKTVEMVSLDALLSESDFVSLNCDLNPTSRHLINRDTLARMKPSAVLVNTARGPIVDNDDLARALEEGAIAGAALDVFEQEPVPNRHPLLSLDNALLAPHNANSSPTAWRRVHENTLAQLFDNLVQRAHMPERRISRAEVRA